jgi:tetratricopeptide (TPR) repeat protein
MIWQCFVSCDKMIGMDEAVDRSSDNDEMLELLQRARHAVYAGLSTDAEEAIEEILSRAQQWAEQHPSPDWPYVVEAAECESRGDWNGTEAAYRQILEMNKEGSHSSVFKANHDLAGVYFLLERESKALEHARSATNAARHDSSPMLLLMALRSETAMLLALNRIEEARRVVAEQCRVLDDDREDKYRQQRASFLVQRARCLRACDQLDDAKSDLDKAYEILGPMASLEFAAGIQADLARWWATTGELCSARNDHESAVNAWREAVTICKLIHTLPHCSDAYTAIGIARMLKGYAEALTHSKRYVDAREAVAERAGILATLKLSEVRK